MNGRGEASASAPMVGAVEPKKQGASSANKDMDAHLQTFDSVPLFMKSLPDEGEDQDTAALDALQSLTFDGTPDEVATSFKKQGNDYFVGKRFKEARGFYTQAIDAHPADTALRESLLTNRAACNLALDNYGLALRDCSEALGLNPASSKAFYRSAKALMALDRFIEAVDCCDHALLVDSQNGEVAKLRASILEKADRVERRGKELEERERRQKEMKIALDKGYLARGLWVQTSAKPPDNPNPPHFDPDSLPNSARATLPLVDSQVKWTAPDSIRSPIVFPVLFLYPQHHTSDLVSHFHEDTPVGTQLEQMFPAEARGSLPWDTAGEYVDSNLNIYATTHGKRLLRLGKKLTLREVMDQGARDADKAAGQERDGVVLQDGILSLVVLPKGKAEADWVALFKRERDEASKKTSA